MDELIFLIQFIFMTWIPEYLVLVGMERMRHILKEINSSKDCLANT